MEDVGMYTVDESDTDSQLLHSDLEELRGTTNTVRLCLRQHKEACCLLVFIIFTASFLMGFLLWFREPDVTLVEAPLLFSSISHVMNGTQQYVVTNNNFFPITVQGLGVTVLYKSRYNNRYHEFDHTGSHKNLFVKVPPRSRKAFNQTFSYHIESERIASSLFGQCQTDRLELAFNGYSNVHYIASVVRIQWGPVTMVSNCSIIGN
mmetsp:Transcript_23269/g.37056  ORF Transcript_23269/g.37056 Transcript_23269/m.37056 type:complete len:206 (+) Transcript_23269:357-974(+)